MSDAQPQRREPPEMTPRQRFALTHPLGSADLGPGALDPYTTTRRHATGLMLRTILAVDR